MEKNKICEIEINAWGRVQGVNFRISIKKFADENGIAGYVMNKTDGSVLIIGQAEKSKLKKTIKWIEGSPGLSKVERIEVEWKKAKARYPGFNIIKEGNFLVDQARSFLNLGRSLVIEKNARVPRHIAIIPDGNRRWAREKGLGASYGHYTAASPEHVTSLFEEAKKLGAKYMTLWGFSTENWNRDKREIKAIFNYILENIEEFSKNAKENKIRFRHLGRKDRLPRKLVNELIKLERETEDYNEFNVQLCLDYGGRDEMIRAVNSLLKKGKRKISEEDFLEFLDSREIPDPDLIIRTSGEQRTSGFMPFQSVYAELYFADVYFPEFDASELRKAVYEFGRRTRRFGATAKEDLISREIAA